MVSEGRCHTEVVLKPWQGVTVTGIGALFVMYMVAGIQTPTDLESPI